MCFKVVEDLILYFSIKTVIFFRDLTLNLSFRHGSTIWSLRVQLTNCLRLVAHFKDTYLLSVFWVKCNFQLV